MHSQLLCCATLLFASHLYEIERIMTDDELKQSKGVFVLKLEGFSMYNDVDPLNKQYGHIILTRTSKKRNVMLMNQYSIITRMKFIIPSQIQYGS